MTTAFEVQVLRVFADPAGGYGNELGVVFGAAGLPGELGVRLTAHLGFSETVFVDDVEHGSFRIFTPAAELKLAGHPTVGTAWALAERTGMVPEVVRPRLAAAVPTWREAAKDGGSGAGAGADAGLDLVWIRGAVADAVTWEYVRLDAPEDIDALAAQPEPGSPTAAQRSRHQFWAWIDEPAGLVRARTFCADIGVPEDEATGSAAIHLTHLLGRPLTIRQGRGSVIEARPAAEPGWAEIGGRVVTDGVRTVTL
jgi:predicted PhzF superfamily epimerase YddE/YHI9